MKRYCPYLLKAWGGTRRYLETQEQPGNFFRVTVLFGSCLLTEVAGQFCCCRHFRICPLAHESTATVPKMRLRCIGLLLAAAAVAALPCAAHSSDVENSESRPPITERSAVDGRDGTAVSQARDFASGEERRRLRSSSKAAFSVDEAAETFARFFPDRFGPHIRSNLDGQVDTLSVQAVKDYLNLRDDHMRKMELLLQADDNRKVALAKIILSKILEAEKERILQETALVRGMISVEHNPVTVVRALMRKTDLNLEDDHCVRTLENYISHYNWNHQGTDEGYTLDDVMSAARNSMDEHARRLSVAQTSAGDESTAKLLHKRLIEAGGQ